MDTTWPLCDCGGIATSNASGDITRTCIRCGKIVRQLTAAKLLTETNTQQVERKVRRDAIAQLRIPRRFCRAIFEHDQWWVMDIRNGAQWAVNDTNIGVFDFEQVTSPSEA